MQRTYGFGIAAHPVEGVEGRARATELCDLLSRETSVRFYPHFAMNYRELAEAMRNKGVALAWMPPLPTLELADANIAQVLVLPTRRGVLSYHSALYTKRSSAIRALSDLKGKRVAWTDRESAAGYVVPRLHIASQGLDVNALFAQELFVRTHEEAVEAVLSGRADVGATYVNLDPATGRILHGGWTSVDGVPRGPIDVLAVAGPIPNDAIIVSNALPAEVRIKAQRWFLTIDNLAARQLLAGVLRAEGFRLASNAHYEPLRRLVQQARAADLSPASSKSGPTSPRRR